ncbi:MAG: hypothetical protein U9Q81_13125, partial [Pseudomonadota bacterium]|nr:hypothetical protein [Pseudomonadota bacterium]
MARKQIATRIGNTKTLQTRVASTGSRGNAGVKQRLRESGYGQQTAIFVNGVGLATLTRTPRFGNTGQLERRFETH